MRIPDHPIIERLERNGYIEDAQYTLCESCEGEVYKGETLYYNEGKWLCNECFIDAITEFVKWKTDEFAAEYGHDTKEAVYD